MTPEELLNQILIEYNLMQASKRKNIALFGERSVKLIEKAKREWERSAINRYLRDSD